MKKAIICVKKSTTDSYVGGVITIINQYLANSELFERNGVETKLFNHQMKRTLKNSKLNNVLYGFSQCRALLSELKRNPVDVVNIHTSCQFLFLKDVWLAKQIAKKRGVKVVLTVHVGAAETVFGRIGRFRKMALKILNRYVFKTVFLSKEIQKEFVAMGVEASRTEVLYNFHCMEPIETEDRLPETSKLHLLFVGAIHREKGIMELLEALVALPDVDFHLDICGKLTDGSIRERFEELVATLGEKVTLNGYVSGKAKTALFERADLLLLPSYHEGMPLVILEALASGCAVVSTRVGATPEILDESNAIWVDIADADAIRNAVLALDSQSERLEQMKQANLLLAKDFTIEANIRALCEIYELNED